MSEDTPKSGFDLDVLDLSKLKLPKAPPVPVAPKAEPPKREPVPRPEPAAVEPQAPPAPSRLYKIVIPILIIAFAGTAFLVYQLGYFGHPPATDIFPMVGTIEDHSGQIFKAIENMERQSKFFSSMSQIERTIDMLESAKAILASLSGQIDQLHLLVSQQRGDNKFENLNTYVEILKIYDTPEYRHYIDAINEFLRSYESFILNCRDNLEPILKQERQAMQKFDAAKFKFKVAFDNYNTAHKKRIQISNETLVKYPILTELYPERNQSFF